jgi:YVTN family beta-propeller protein
VVSLYSKGQVLVGGTPVTVGSNPTAVAAYPYSESQVFESGNYAGVVVKVTTTTMRALVANSGSNSVSVVDTLYDDVLSTITVGNQPVALAASSNGSTAYVANYTDGTVSQVNLSTNAVTATVAVGGKPTSLALTANGILWVGGAGFLTEINTQNMSVTATESTAGRAIIALGYSDAENELVATTTDLSGNVYVDEVNPSIVQPGGAYTPAASNSVSMLGTYLNPKTQTQVRGFTSTLATSSVPIYTSQPGAPPLVVQDGWAVVTATPTGFTISDVSGNIVLVSETTPSPVTAIAVDTNLNDAYLVMPDSNTLLTVPLPGMGSN